jgi:2'-5' RNA ligase
MAERAFTIGGVIWPDAETQKSVNEIRKRYDPHFGLIAPHITIIFPADTEIALEEVVTRLQNAVEGFRPFQVRLDRVSSLNLLAPAWPAGTSALLAYPNARNAIFLLSGEGSREILQLKERLAAGIGLDTPLVQYPPYLTLGQTLSQETYEAALQALSGYAPDFSFPVRGFDLLTDLDSGRWRKDIRIEFPA